jgi:transcription elongation GreA/GreB family factor
VSRAFVREDDANTPPETLPDIAVPPLPNPVTARGMALIEAAIHEIEAGLHTQADAADASEAEHAADLRRRLRYWTARRATAQITEPPADPQEVGFGSRVTLDWPGRGKVVMRIVGDDEGDPASGRIGWRAATAATLIGNGVGDAVQAEIGGRSVTLTILEVENSPEPAEPAG